MADFRVMNSLLVLRDQVNQIAPNRSKASDGTVCDQNHPSDSDHCPHNVPGVGPNMVTALDLTHDPDGGFNSFTFAEVLRIHRDPRIKYVISNRRIFDSSGSDAWQWRPYTGTNDPHTNHVHISVLNAAISDTKTLWDLEGFNVALSDDDIRRIWSFFLGASGPNTGQALQNTNGNTANLPAKLTQLQADTDDLQASQKVLAANQLTMDQKLDAILAKLNQGGGGTTFPPSSTFTSSGTIIWDPAE